MVVVTWSSLWILVNSVDLRTDGSELKNMAGIAAIVRLDSCGCCCCEVGCWSPVHSSVERVTLGLLSEFLEVPDRILNTSAGHLGVWDYQGVWMGALHHRHKRTSFFVAVGGSLNSKAKHAFKLNHKSQMFFIPVAIGDNHKSQMPSVGGERITNTTTKRQLESQSPRHLIWGIGNILLGM